MDNDDLLLGRFQVLKKIHSGKYADIYKGFDSQSEDFVAMKFLAQSSPFGKTVVDYETQVLARLQHDNIVRYITSGFDPASERPFLITEWLEPRSLSSRLGMGLYGSWNRFWVDIGEALLSALVYLHEHDVHHRDVHPGNILFTEDGALRLADFGIAQVIGVLEGRETDFMATPPFTPPGELGSFASFRDVYGYCAIAVSCMGDQLPADQDDLDSISSALPSGMAPVETIRRVLSCSRQQNMPTAPELARELRAGLPRSDATALGTVHLRLLDSACRDLRYGYGPVDRSTLQEYVLRDLESEVGVEPAHEFTQTETDTEGFSLYGTYLRLEAVPEMPTGLLTIRKAYTTTPVAVVEQHRFTSFRPNVNFTFQQPGNVSRATKILAALQTELYAFIERRQRNEAERSAERMFEVWSRILRATEELTREQFFEITYKHGHIDGRIFWVQIRSRLSDNLVGSPIEIASGTERVAVGEVVDIRGDNCMIRIESGDIEHLPEEGILRQSQIRSLIAIKRQRNALTRLRNGGAMRPDLKTLLLNPASAEPFEIHSEGFEPVGDIDEDKRLAVLTAKATNDIVVIEGPPGTGKTTFIRELILSLLRDNSNASVLLASQTHVAVDNAMEAVFRASPDTRAVRIAPADDSRVNLACRQHVLSAVAERWAQAALSRGRRYLEQLAVDKGRSLDDIEIGLDLRSLLQLRLRLSFLASRAAELGDAANQVTELPSLDSLDPLDSSDPDLAEEYDSQTSEAFTELAVVRQAIERARLEASEATRRLAARTELGGELAALNDTELRDWIRELLPKETEGPEFLSKVELFGEWTAALLGNEEAEELAVAESQVVAGTCVGVGALRNLDELAFDYVIVDEASKANATEMLVPLVSGRKWIIVGDSQQLPPYVGELPYRDDILGKLNLTRADAQDTLFQHLLNNLPKANVVSLTSQHRMVPGIGHLIGSVFYQGTLKHKRKDPPIALSCLSRPVTWISTSGEKDKNEKYIRGSYENWSEIRVISQLVQDIDRCAQDAPNYKLAIVAAYAAQAARLEAEIRKLPLSSIEVEVSTVDAFQGREANTAIYSIVRSNLKGDIGFLREYRRLNVALSRGRDYLVIVGDHTFVEGLGSDTSLPLILAHLLDNPDHCELVKWTES